MVVPRLVLATFLGVAAAQSSGSSSKVAVDGWYECTAVTFAEQLPTNEADAQSLVGAAQCATFKAPLCYDGICEDTSDKQIDIFVKRIKASSFVSRNAPNIFFMQGGPGAASPAMESAMTNIYSIMNGAVNVYTMDHRGTGRSTKLECVAAQAMTSASPGGTSVDSSEVGSCADEIESKYGSDVSSFSVTSAASDLKYFIDNFLSDQKNFVYGVSYGSSLVERLMHLNTTDIAGYILDGISTTSGSDVKNFEYFSKWDTDFDEVGQYFLSFCGQNDADCGKYFKGSTASETLLTLTNDLDAGTAKCTSALDKIFAKVFDYNPRDISPGSVLRQLMGSLLADSTMRTLIPVVTYRINRCNTDDLSVINHFLTMYEKSLSSTSESEQFTSDLVYKIIVYSEFWEDPTPTYDTMVSRFLNTTISSGSASAVETYCVFTKSTSSACRPFSDYAAYDASPLVYKKDKYWNKAASPPSSVSVLLMSSKMDAQTPHKYAEYLNEALKTDNKQLITFEQATHGTLWSTPLSDTSSDPTCGMRIVASYLSNGGNLARMDKSCVAQMPSVSFEVDSRIVSRYLNATSAYDGTFTGSAAEATKADGSSPSSSTSSSSDSSGTSYKTVFIVFAVLFALAAVAAVVMVVKWRQATKTNAKDVQVYEASNA